MIAFSLRRGFYKFGWLGSLGPHVANKKIVPRFFIRIFKVRFACLGLAGKETYCSKKK